MHFENIFSCKNFEFTFISGPCDLEEGNVVLACPCLDKTIIPADVDINAVTNFLQTLSANAQKRIDGMNKYCFF